MRTLLLMLILISLAVTLNQNSLGVVFALQNPVVTCQDWQELFATLSEAQRKQLQTLGAIYIPDHFILAEHILPDCTLRSQMAAYFERVLNEGESSGDQVFANKYSNQIVKVLQQLWPHLKSRAVLDASLDRVDFTEDIYAFVQDEHISDSALRPFLRQLIKQEGLHDSLVYVVFSRPTLDLSRAIRSQLRIAEKSGDFPSQIYGLAILQMWGDRSVLRKFRQLSASKSLSAYESRLVSELVVKIDRGEKLRYRDVEDLESLNDRYDVPDRNPNQ